MASASFRCIARVEFLTQAASAVIAAPLFAIAWERFGGRAGVAARENPGIVTPARTWAFRKGWGFLERHGIYDANPRDAEQLIAAL